MTGISAISLWLPYRCVLRRELAAAAGTPTVDGSRPVAGADEDALTLAWDALDRLPAGSSVPVAIALDDPLVAVRAQGILGRATGRPVIELGSGPRSGWDLLAAGTAGPLDMVWGTVGWARFDEPVAVWHADGGAAMRWEPDGALRLVAGWQSEGPLPVWRTSAAGCVLDWSAADDRALFAACTEAFAALGIDPSTDIIAISCPLPAVFRRARRQGWNRVLGTDFAQRGYARCAEPAFVLAQALAEMNPGERVALIVPGAGVTIMLLELDTEAAPPVVIGPRWAAESPVPPARWSAFRRRDGHGQAGVEMSASLGWREVPWQLERLGFRCADCGELSWPAQQNCIVCGAREGGLEPVAETGTVFTGTVDHLHASLDPPVAMVVAELDGGGRAYLQGTDDLAHAAPIGTPVEMTLRRYHDGERGETPHYFWKLRSRA